MKWITVFLLWGMTLTLPVIAQKGRSEVLEGNQLYGEERYQDALRKYEEGLSKNPDSAVLQFNRGGARYKLGQLEEALKAYQESLALETDEDRSKAYYNLGNAQFRTGDIQESLESFKEALRLNPENKELKDKIQKLEKQ